MDAWDFHRWVYSRKLQNLLTFSASCKISSFKNENWHIQPSCALTNAGLFAGLDWLELALKMTFQLPLCDNSKVEKRDIQNEPTDETEAKKAKMLKWCKQECNLSIVIRYSLSIIQKLDSM